VVGVRENDEDLYAGIEHRPTQNVTQCLKLITWKGPERIVRNAFLACPHVQPAESELREEKTTLRSSPMDSSIASSTRSPRITQLSKQTAKSSTLGWRSFLTSEIGMTLSFPMFAASNE